MLDVADRSRFDARQHLRFDVAHRECEQPQPARLGADPPQRLDPVRQGDVDKDDVGVVVAGDDAQTGVSERLFERLAVDADLDEETNTDRRVIASHPARSLGRSNDSVRVATTLPSPSLPAVYRRCPAAESQGGSKELVLRDSHGDPRWIDRPMVSAPQEG